MTDQEMHDLAVAYAQVRLIEMHKADPFRIGSSEDIRAYLKAYHFALIQIPEENQEIDLSSLQ